MQQNGICAEVIAELMDVMPPIFLGVKLDDYTGGAAHWPTIQNIRANSDTKDHIPPECFLYAGRKVLIRRDPFLRWWGSKLTAVPAASKPAKPKPRQGSEV